MIEVTKEGIRRLKERTLQGGTVTPEEALALAGIQSPELFHQLIDAAREITVCFHQNRMELCALINAKSYSCGEDCKFCAQSVHYQTEADRYGLVEEDRILEVAKKAEKSGAKCFCIVTSGESLSDEEFETVLQVVRRLKQETTLRVDGSLGYLTVERARALKAAGLCRVNNNVQTSENFYSKIVSTHPYSRRLEALRNLKEAGLELCAGGILGLGETREDRIQMAFELKAMAPECIPVNILNPRPGTPLEHMPRLEVEEIIKTVAVFRFIHPCAIIKLAGGREFNLGENQETALRAGANGLIIGGYLTTESDPVQEDLKLVERAGYSIKGENRDPKAEGGKEF